MDKNNFKAVRIQELEAEQLFARFEALEKKLDNLNQSTTHTPPQLLTRKQTADLFGVSLVTLHNWVNKGILPAFRIGNKVRFKHEDVMQALNQINCHE